MLAKGDGLTFIGSHNYNRNEGNVHSGAPPPWLLSSEEETTSGEIGPTIDSYKAHLEREKKKKLPANRVGAKFDHQQSTDQAWLPSFGRVWSKGGRQQSKKYFQRISSTTKKCSTISNFTASSDRDTLSSSVYSSENDIQNRVESKMNGDMSVQSNAGENEHSFQNGVRTENYQIHSNSTFPFHHQSGSEVDTNFSVAPRNNVKPYVKKHRPESTASGYTQTQGQAQYEHGGMNQLQPQSYGGNLNMNHLNQSGSYLNHSMNPSIQPVMNESTYSVNQWSQSTSYSAQPASQSTQAASYMTHSRTAKPYVRKRKSEDIGSTEVNLMGHIPVIPTPILEAKAPPSTSRWK